MRLLVIEPGLRLWGSERAFLATVPALVAAYERVVVMLPPGAELAEALREHQVTVETAPIGDLKRAGYLAKLQAAASILDACRRHRIDRIYLNQAGLCRIVHAVARLLALPSVIHVRLVEDIGRCRQLTATAAAPIALILISKDMRRRYPTPDPEPYKTQRTVYDPFEMSDKPVSVAPRSRQFACVGRLTAIKGQIELIDGFANGAARLGNAGLDLIGAAAPGDPYGEAAATRCAKYDLAGRVRFLGYRTDAIALMSDYRFVIVPSRYEPLGRVVFEAWSTGALPICSADSGGAAELIQATGGGLLYNGHAPESIAAALESAMSLDECERQALVENGRKWARTYLTIDAYRRALQDVLFPVTNSDGAVAV